jgi:hypothetical protein
MDGRTAAANSGGVSSRLGQAVAEEWEHAFGSIRGSSYARFRRSLETGRLSIVLMAAAELLRSGWRTPLRPAAIAQEHHPRFDRAAARWVGRLLAEQPFGLADPRFAPALVEQAPHGRESLQRLARRC